MRRGEASLAEHAPYTSKDIDFCGGVSEGRRCAAAIGGTLLVPGSDDRSPNSCVIQYVDASNQARKIDFLNAPFGLDREEVFRLRLPLPLSHSAGRLWVMHPVHCLESRAHNVAALPGYDSAHALGQLRASITCARAFLTELLDQNETKAVLKLNERVFRFSHRLEALQIFKTHGIDVFLAATNDRRLPPKFWRGAIPRCFSSSSGSVVFRKLAQAPSFAAVRSPHTNKKPAHAFRRVRVLRAGGGGGSRTRVRESSTMASTCVFRILL